MASYLVHARFRWSIVFVIFVVHTALGYLCVAVSVSLYITITDYSGRNVDGKTGKNKQIQQKMK
jgi:hypothetical protein